MLLSLRDLTCSCVRKGRDVSAIQFMEKGKMKVLLGTDRHSKVKSIDQSHLPWFLISPLVPFFLSASSASCSYHCLQEHNITICYWMAILHVWMSSRVQPAGKQWYVCECLYLSEHIQLSVCVFGLYTHFSALASWLPLTCTPLPQSTYPCLPQHTDLGYCPTQSTLESSTSPLAF